MKTNDIEGRSSGGDNATSISWPRIPQLLVHTVHDCKQLIFQLIVFVQILLLQFLFDRLLSLFKCLKFEYWIQRLKKTSCSPLVLVCLWLVSTQIKGVINLNHSCGVGGKEPNRNYYQRKWYWYKYIILNSMCLSWNGSWHTCCEMMYLQRLI